MPPFMQDKSGVYCISCKANGKQYVGCSKRMIGRLKTHFADLKRGLHSNSHLQSAWDKYGASNFYVFVIQYTDRIKDVEVKWIARFDSYYNGFNKTLGGDGILVLDEKQILEYRERINESLRRPEVRSKIGEWSKKFHADNKEKMRTVLKENALKGWEKRKTEKRTWMNNGVEEKLMLVELVKDYPDWKHGRLKGLTRNG